MEHPPNYQAKILERTFSVFEEKTNRWTQTERDKLSGLQNLLQGQIDPKKLRMAFVVVNAEYSILPGRDLESLIERVKLQFGEMEEALAKKVLSWIVFGTENGFDGGNAHDLLARQIRLNHGLDQEAPMGEEVENATGQFGFSPTNPIPINGIDRIRDYFSRLRTLTGESVTYKRMGIKPVESLPFPVDEYELYGSASNLIATLFLYAYHGKTTEKAPEGFQLTGEF